MLDNTKLAANLLIDDDQQVQKTTSAFSIHLAPECSPLILILGYYLQN